MNAPTITVPLAQWEALQARIAELEAKLAELTKTPRNSSKPPSSEHPHAKPLPRKPKSNRKRGGQHGHQKYERALILVDQCVAVFVHKPPSCRGCGGKLTGVDPAPLRHQVWDVPKIEPLVTEHLRHRLAVANQTVHCQSDMVRIWRVRFRSRSHASNGYLTSLLTDQVHEVARM